MGFLHGIMRAAQVMKVQLDIRVIDRPLENLAIHPEDGCPDRFGLSHNAADRPLEGIAFHRARDSHQ
jgi:hypothetical protein